VAKGHLASRLGFAANTTNTSARAQQFLSQNHYTLYQILTQALIDRL